MSTQAQLLTKESTNNIYNKTASYNYWTEQHVGEPVSFMITGNGTIMDVETKDGEKVLSRAEGGGAILRKQIFNAKAISDIAMRNERNAQMFRDAYALELQGEKEKAHELYKKFLNAVQVSFTVLLPAKHHFYDGCFATGIVSKITTEKGSLLTITDVAPKPVVSSGAKQRVDLGSLFIAENIEKPKTAFTPEKEIVQPG